MAHLIMHDLHIAKDPVGNLFYYNKGVYKPGGDWAIKEIYCKYLESMQWLDKWKPTMADGLVNFIRGVSPMLLDRPIINKINLLNGIYDFYEEPEHAFTESTPEYLTTIQLPIVYDPNAECLAWDKFLTDVFPEGVQLLQEIVGMCCIPFTKLQKCIILMGTGSNGKGVYLRALQDFIGTNNVSHIQLNKLSDRFVTSGLVGKLLNVFGDLSGKALKDTSAIKALTGEDSIEVEFKGKSFFTYFPFTRYIFCTNTKVSAEEDNSSGFKRRFLEIPFTRVFAVDPKIGDDLAYNLSKPSELSGMFNKVKLLLPNLVENGFTISEQVAGLIDNFIPIPGNIRQWLTEHVVEDPNGALPGRAFWDYYSTTCPTPPHNVGHSRVEMISFMRAMFPECQANKVVRVWKGQPPVRAFVGVKLSNPHMYRHLLERSQKVRDEEDEGLEVVN